MNERNETQNEMPARLCHPASVWTGFCANMASIGAIAALMLVTQSQATPFTFSTGDPDGKIATLSRPAGPAGIQTETADDLVVTQSIVLTQATFTGLLPLGAPLTSITGVEIEFYHVFPGDSNTNRTPNVPTRANSPGDVEIGSATRDSANGTLSFVPSLVRPSFTASNSVVTNIIAGQAPFTGGEGAVTGQVVTITVTFNPPIALPTNHYFFRPEVALERGDFLWLSAPRPIVAPGTPFVGDLQTWIRNDTLAPDWLRIGTDITHQGPFNAAFSLSGETDEDGDGVADSRDLCPGTPEGSLVDADGCSLDQLAPCAGPASGGVWKNHGQFVSTVVEAVHTFVDQGLITQEQAEHIIVQAAHSNCGRKTR